MSTFIRPHSLAVTMSPYSGKAKVLYRDYLQQQSFVKDITDSSAKVQYAISENAREIIATHEQLQEHGFELLESIDSGITEINQNLEEVDGTLRSGFALLSYGLEDISNGIETLTAKCDWGFSRMISEIGHVNDTLNELLAVAKTPAQTWAYNQFEIGRDAMRQELYPEALEAVLRAINGFGDQTGYKLEWRFHYELGIIYLGDVKNTDPAILDLAKAEQSFLAAARYAKADFPSEASIAFTAAGWAAYCQTKFPDAETHTQQAIQLDASSKNPEAYYQLAKIQMRTDRPADALPRLRKAIEMDRNYMLKAATDPDFLKYNRQMESLFEEMRKASVIEAKKAVAQILKSVEVMRSWHTDEKFSNQTQSVEHDFRKVSDSFETSTYFGCLDAIQFSPKVKDEADALVKEQKDLLSAKVARLAALMEENRSRISIKVKIYGVQKWQEAEAAHSQITYPLTFPSFSYGDYQNQIDRLSYVNKLYEASETSVQNKFDESISSAELSGKISGGIMGGMVGCLVGGVLGEIVAIIVGTSISFNFLGNWNSHPDWGSLFLGFGVFGLVFGCVMGAVIGSSRWGKEWRRKREEEIRRKTGR